MALLTTLLSSSAGADGTETLGPPSITIASGNDTVAGGTGLENAQPGVIALEVPEGVSVEQVLVYWEGQSSSDTSGFDDDIVLDGTTVPGVLIGGPTLFFGSTWSSTYRADITELGLVAPGSNSIAVSGLTFDQVSNGAGILVITSDGGPDSELTVLDGNDLAFIDFEAPLDATVPQTVTFPAGQADRVATIDIFASSVAGTTGSDRPNIILVTVDGVVSQFDNILDNSDGEEWDTVRLDVDIPAGATSLTLELVSDDPADPDTGNTPASMAFNAAAFNIPAVGEPGIDIEKLTNGNDADGPNDSDVPRIAPGDPVTWTYLVTNTGDLSYDIADVDVTDDIIGDITDIVDQGDGDDTLAPGETWTYQTTAPDGAQDLLAPAPGTIIVQGCNPDGTSVPGDRATYENIGTVTVPDDSDTDPSHYCNPVEPEIDIEKFTKVIPVPVDGDVCESPNKEQFGKPIFITMRYTGEGAAADNNSQGDRSDVSGDPNGASPVYIVASKDSGGSGEVFFSDTVELGGSFVIDGNDGGDTAFGSATHVTIFAFPGGPVLQEVEIHTSCSAPLIVGEQFGSLILEGLVGEDGLVVDLPQPDPSDIGEDADTPTGPQATTGDTIQWTYLVTNPGDVPLTDVVVGDDNGTVGDPSDDFAPTPVTEGGVNVGDDDGDGNLDPGEVWVYRATGTAVLGQYANLGDVAAVPVGGGDEVTDEDPSHYVAVFGQDICEAFEKPVTLTMRYTGEGPDATSNSQDSDKVDVSGDPAGASPVVIEVNGDPIGTVELGETFEIIVDGSNTNVVISSPSGQQLQEIDFHTSCSQPLFIGDQFGAIELVDSVDKNGQGPSNPDFVGVLVEEREYKEDRVKVKLRNTGSTPVAISEIEISFPTDNGLLKKVKAGSDYDPNPDLGSPASIVASDFNDPEKVIINADDKRDIEFEFTDKNKDPAASEYTIVIRLADGTVFTL